MSDDESKLTKTNEIVGVVNDLNDNVQTLTRLNVRHETMIEDIKDSLRSIRRRLDELEASQRGTATRSRRGNIRNRPARGGKRIRRKKRTRRRRKRKRKTKRKRRR